MQGSIDNQKQSIQLSGTANAADLELSHAASGHEEHPDLRIFGLFMFLIAEASLFLGLFVAYLAFRSVAPVWPPEGTPKLELLLPGLNTVVLISSSLVIHQADAAIKKNDVAGLRKWFAITAAMGILFLCGQVYEYMHLEFGLRTNLFASTFYVLTGFHGLHVTVGVLLILSVLWRSIKNADHYSSTSHFGVEAAEIYWHFVDVVWIVLFTLLYLL
jgi:cytochrome c oxidase subunit III